MEITRRHLLAGLVAGGASLALERDAFAARPRSARGTILGFGKGIAPDGTPLFVGAIADLDDRSLGLVDLDFFGHGFARHPTQPDRAIVFEKRGPGCCEIDLKQRRMVRKIPAPPGCSFYGHGTFSKDGETLFVAETELKSYDGRIAILDGKTLEEIGTFPTYGSSPHDCMLVGNGAALAVTNGGSAAVDSPGSVAFVEVKTGKLLEKLPVPDQRLNAGHVAISEKGDVVAISAPRDGLPLEEAGGVSIRPAKGSFATMGQPAAVTKGLRGEALSVAVHDQRRLAAVTHPDANLVTIWDLATAKLVKTLSMPAPRGITATLDGADLVVSHSGGKLSMVPWRDLEAAAPLPLGQTPFGGSHLYTLRPIG
ncbi:MAG TPA: DUF1513 domain-containing protein [Vulgatibacter sp.]